MTWIISCRCKMETYNKVLNWIVTGILTVLLLSILCVSAVIYPPFSFISYQSPAEKILLLKKFIVPSVVILICVLLEYIQNRKISLHTLIAVTVTLIGNIFGGIAAERFDTTKTVYFICGLNFNGVPLCLMLLAKDITEFKLPKFILYIPLSLLAVLYAGFTVTIFYGSYVLVMGFMYLSLPTAVISNITVFCNSVLRRKTIASVYIVNWLFTLYNMIWYWGNTIITVLGILSGVIIAVLIGFIIFDVRNYKKSLAIWNKV